MLSVNFYIQRKRINRKNEVPIVMRIKLQGSKRDISTGLRIDSEKWNSTPGLAQGTSAKAQQINELLSLARNKMLKLFAQFSYAGDVDVDGLVSLYHGKVKSKLPNLLHLVTEHNKQIQKRIGIDYARSTFEKYWAMEMRINQYVKDHLMKKDIALKQLDRKKIHHEHLILCLFKSLYSLYYCA